jgi:hypothetical protein
MSNTNGIEVIYAKRTIVITKSFEEKARKFGSDEYKNLKEARQDNPTFRIVIKSTSKADNKNKGLTFSYMAQFIEYFMPELMDEYFTLRGMKANDNGKYPPAKTMIEIQNWFRIKRDEYEKNKAQSESSTEDVA